MKKCNCKNEKKKGNCCTRIAKRGIVGAILLVLAGAVVALKTDDDDEADQILIKKDKEDE